MSETDRDTKLSEARNKLAAVRKEIHKRVQGMDEVIDAVFIVLFSPGNNNHLLMEAPPGTGKTLLVRTVAEVCDVSFKRIQMTPGTLSEDITGDETPIFDRNGNMTGKYDFVKGPIFANIVLTDEINRTHPKTTSALLEVMEELQVTTKRCGTYELELPFNVFATQNPRDQVSGGGTYPLSAAHTDRFMMKVNVPYLSSEELIRVMESEDANLQSRSHDDKEIGVRKPVNKVISGFEILSIRDLIDKEIFVSRELRKKIDVLVSLTRPGGDRLVAGGKIVEGAATRFPLFLQRAIKAKAFLSGRGYVTESDIIELTPSLLGHRLRYDGEIELSKREDVLREALNEIFLKTCDVVS